MVGLSTLLIVLAVLAATPVVVFGGFLAYTTWMYCPVIRRIFQERPVFQPLKIVPEDLGEPAAFPTADGLTLKGSYFKARTDSRVGVLVYCHEFLSDRWSYAPYLDHLRDRGFDVFSFDFRSHGASAVDPSYEPLQYASDREVEDLRAALAYLRSRPDRDLSGYGLFGVSRGGGTALLVAAAEPDVWGVVTDGAFPTRGTMTAYIVRWAEIYVRSRWFLALVPRFIFATLGDVARRGTERARNCTYPSVERAVARLSPRPWLQIHGERDVYIGTDIAHELFDWAGEPRSQWFVADAKHNRCRETEPEEYARRLGEFVDLHAPRRPLAEIEEEIAASEFGKYDAVHGRAEASGLITNIASSVTG
ncbi:alpha/beta hydrolase [Planctomyces sp. SH-PL62]|uniref:alpha/beta hydrolase n=1 Tax=Planctomyces sp. SH-PL62 TaxID=1636152 RepID=UPI00078DEB0B|nr:alpha/beta fold hydrolase [Planctomyces sp. SH-PL62]AMV39469.1 Alpha/beta hydrolase family protein [Planctomyces sp. SH-PL62]